MTTKIVSYTPLSLAKELARCARVHDTEGSRKEAKQCRKYSFAYLQLHTLLTDDAPPPNQWLLERLIAANEATSKDTAAA